ncbi:MAG: acetoacetate decarboxylase family protein [Burkholderiaceae bacterium]
MTRAWKGQSSPRSATGRSALVEPLPHHISSDALHVVFAADPAKVAQFLPPGLEPLEDGRGWAMVADMAKVSAEAPEQYWKDPKRSCYSEGLVGFYCRHGDRVGRYSAFVWVDRDWSMGMGQIFGWSKRLASIHRTRLNDVNPGMPAFGAGATLAGTVERNGHSVLRVEVEFGPDAKKLEAMPDFAAASLLYRYVASPGPGIDEVEQLLELSFSNVKSADIWSGTGRVQFGQADDEELSELGEVRVLGGYAYRRGWTTDRTATLLHDYAAARRNGTSHPF